jgi:hypothetical protein
MSIEFAVDPNSTPATPEELARCLAEPMWRPNRWWTVVFHAIVSSMETPNSNPRILPASLAAEAWAAWQERLNKGSLMPAPKEQATSVLLKLIRLCAERHQSL